MSKHFEYFTKNLFLLVILRWNSILQKVLVIIIPYCRNSIIVSESFPILSLNVTRPCYLHPVCRWDNQVHSVGGDGGGLENSEGEGEFVHLPTVWNGPGDETTHALS